MALTAWPVRDFFPRFHTHQSSDVIMLVHDSISKYVQLLPTNNPWAIAAGVCLMRHCASPY